MSHAVLGHKTLKFIKGYYYAPYDMTPKINTLLENIISGTDEPINQSILNQIDKSNQDFTDINNQLEEIIEGGVISFTIEGIQYYADDGMTWDEWVRSGYNVDRYYIEGLGGVPIIHPNGNGYIVESTARPAFTSELIINNHNYSIYWY